MRRQVLVSLVVIGALGALTVGDCFASPILANHMAQHETMKCCASMPCTQANQHEDCCRTMSTVEGQQFAPKAKFSAPAPELTAAMVQEAVVPVIPSPVATLTVEIHEHGPPPDLYTNYHSLLI